jgi:NAD(P)-dependent dehydrogenase (short-subunit alcohol dehydrogenase family)
VESVVCDVTSTAQVDALISSTTARLGRLDVLVNNAGLGGRRPVVDMTDEEWDRGAQRHPHLGDARDPRGAGLLPRRRPRRRYRQQRQRIGWARSTPSRTTPRPRPV